MIFPISVDFLMILKKLVHTIDHSNVCLLIPPMDKHISRPLIPPSSNEVLVERLLNVIIKSSMGVSIQVFNRVRSYI